MKELNSPGPYLGCDDPPLTQRKVGARGGMDVSITTLTASGFAALALAIVAWLGDHRRSDPEAVGFMDWTTLSFFALFIAVLLLLGLGLAAREWVRG